MRIPRDIDAGYLVKMLRKVDYQVTRQVGSHIRLTRTKNGEHHITVPNHNPIKVGTLSAILADIAQHLQISKDDLIKIIF